MRYQWRGVIGSLGASALLLLSVGCGGSSGNGGATNVLFTAGSSNVAVNSNVVFDASKSTGLTGTETFEWNFGDGTVETQSASGSHTFSTSGQFDVSLTVKDEDGNVVGTFTIQDAITVFDPALAPGGTVNGLPAGGALGEAPATVTVDGTTLTAPAGTSIIGITWDWGDGSAAENTSATGSATHDYTNTGGTDIDYKLTALVKYDDGTIGKTEITVTVSPDTTPPVITITSLTPKGTTDESATVTVSMNGGAAQGDQDTDPMKWERKFDIPDDSVGKSYTFDVNAEDGSGNKSPTKSITVTFQQ